MSDYRFGVSFVNYSDPDPDPTAQSLFTNSNGGTVTAHHVLFAREKSLTSFTPGKLCIQITSLNTILLACLNDFILGSVRNIKMKCVGAAYLDSRKILY